MERHICAFAAVYGYCSHFPKQPSKGPEEELFLYHYVGSATCRGVVGPGNNKVHHGSMRNSKDNAFVLGGGASFCSPAHPFQKPFAESLLEAHNRKNFLGVCCGPVFHYHLFPEVLHYEVLAERGVVTHVELKYLVGRVFLVDVHGVQTHVVADEILELFIGDFSKSLEPGDFRALSELLDALQLFRLAVAVAHVE